MSDYLDYENNLAFDPTSADDLNEQGRQSEVLVAALEKCEKLEQENKQLKELLGKCRTMLGQFEIKNPEPTTYDVVEILLKIDNAIGEK